MDKTQLTNLVVSGCSTRKIASQTGLSQTTVRYWLVKFGLKTEVKHKCGNCGTNDPLKFTKGRYSECRRCRVRSQKDRYHKYKVKAVAYKGGKCVSCGYNACLASLDFHHKNPAEKDPRWKTMRSWTFERVKQELDKCILVCRNCHGEIHYGAKACW